MRERATDGVSDLLDGDVSRRGALKTIFAGATALAGGTAVDNVLLGYGVVVGTNLREQDLAPLAVEALEPSPFSVSVGDVQIAYMGATLEIADGDRERTVAVDDLTPERGAEVDDAFDLPGASVERFAADLPALRRGDLRFEFDEHPAFFDRLEGVDPRPLAVETLRSRRWSDVEPATVERFTGVSPDDSRAVVEALADGFREHTYYDAARYVAGSIDDHVLLGRGDLREHFASPTTFEAMEDGDDTGLFCWDFTHRSIEALQAVPAHHQIVPTFGWEVYDRRHGHVFTAVGSVYRRERMLVVPMTFLDYSRATWYDDYRLRWLMGEGIGAYDRRHRATRFVSR